MTSPRCLRDTGGDPGNGAGERVAPKCYHNIMELGLNLASGDSLYINCKKKKKKKAVKTSGESSQSRQIRIFYCHMFRCSDQ